MDRLLKDDPHISNAAKNMDSYRVVRGRVNAIGYPPDERLMPYLEQAGFGSAALIRTFNLRYDLLSALVERWRPETQTFHFPCGECTMTLEDVALQLGLLIDGSPVTGLSANATEGELIYHMMIEQHTGEGFIWMPYRRTEIAAILPSTVYVDSHMWCINAPIISFNVVE
ncbi:hypothetical protein J1N35_013414 [Gossypium stocksii]|uniref:Aminotransferase-like plant mobile domain-containing protein n=1 Tax=Gossypium stocksii TaxID=47602 RepID=A0A9D3VTR6_9ROSI|nr:hypothetical protein J1N35_013414 [Gossypium stocksii]